MLSMPRIVRPDHPAPAGEFGSPAGSTTRRSIKRDKELARIFRPELVEVNRAELPFDLKKVLKALNEIANPALCPNGVGLAVALSIFLKQAHWGALHRFSFA